MKVVYRFLMKLFLCIILFLVLGILCKMDVQYKEYINNKLYQESISFSSFRNFYNQYLGGVFPIENFSKMRTNYVFNEKLNYQQIKDYEEGAMLSVSKNYLVPNMEEGIVVYVGEKEKYGNVIIVENRDGIDIWYGNLCNSLVKLYDTVEAGAYLGEACEDVIYLVYTKGNNYLDYQEYLKS